MKSLEFKKIIKEAVREAIQEELREIILEAVKAPKDPLIKVQGYGADNKPITESKNILHIRDKYRSLVEGMRDTETLTFNMTSEDAQGYGGNGLYTPPLTANTTGEGSALPPGEVSLDQLMSLIGKR